MSSSSAAAPPFSAAAPPPPPGAGANVDPDDYFLRNDLQGQPRVKASYQITAPFTHTCRVPRCQQLPNGKWLCQKPNAANCLPAGPDAFFVKGSKVIAKLDQLRAALESRIAGVRGAANATVLNVRTRAAASEDAFQRARAELAAARRNANSASAAQRANAEKALAAAQGNLNRITEEKRAADAALEELRARLAQASAAAAAADRKADQAVATVAARVANAESAAAQASESQRATYEGSLRELRSALEAAQGRAAATDAAAAEAAAAAAAAASNAAGRISAAEASARAAEERAQEAVRAARAEVEQARSSANAATGRARNEARAELLQRQAALEAAVAREATAAAALATASATAASSSESNAVLKVQLKAVRTAYNRLRDAHIRHLQRILARIDNKATGLAIFYNSSDPEFNRKKTQIQQQLAALVQLPNGNNIKTEDLARDQVIGPIETLQSILDADQSEENREFGLRELAAQNPATLSSPATNEQGGGRRRTRKRKLMKRKQTKKRHGKGRK